MYFVFASDWYYPSGGSGNCKGIFDTLEEAKVKAAEYAHYDDVSIEVIHNHEFVNYDDPQLDKK